MTSRGGTRRGAYVAAVFLSAVGCRSSDFLSVPPPAGVTPSSGYQSMSGAEALLAHGRAQVTLGLVGSDLLGNGALVQWTGLLADELRWTAFKFGAASANIDARQTIGTGGFSENGDPAIQGLLGARLTLLSAIPLLKQFEPASGQSKIGEAFALVGYAELAAAEDYCPGVSLDALGPTQGVIYGQPLTTDSLLGVAAADFDSAAAYASGDVVIAPLAQVGRARVLLDRGRFAAAGTAASSVPVGFAYDGMNTQPTYPASPFELNVYEGELAASGCGFANVADVKGSNGVNFVSAHDPRLVLNAAIQMTCDGLVAQSPDSVWYYPAKFGNPSTTVALATGVEAQLIVAEAALQASDVTGWTSALNALRMNAPSTYLALAASMMPLTVDSTTTASATERVDVMFRERAFWLFGMGARLSDLRRLVRQYGRDQSTVFPTGPYPNGANPNLPTPLPNYGTDVALTLPTKSSGFSTANPYYKGCTVSTKTA